MEGGNSKYYVQARKKKSKAIMQLILPSPKMHQKLPICGIIQGHKTGICF